eukprot:gene23360-24785_t
MPKSPRAKGGGLLSGVRNVVGRFGMDPNDLATRARDLIDGGPTGAGYGDQPVDANAEGTLAAWHLEASIFRGLNVEDNIRAVLEVSEPDRHARAEQLEQLLEEFDIARLRKSPSIALSGGERRRCEIARALAARPSFVLLDEPFAGIDPIAVGDIQTLVHHLTQRGIGVLITDHNV